MRPQRACALAVLLLASIVATSAQRGGTFGESSEHPAIRYSATPARDPVALLSSQIQDGRTQLSFDPDNGYLRSVLDALRVPIESQVAVFSGTSSQAAVINARNPRALYFNDAVAVGWVRGGDILELAAVDPTQGVIFYTLDQRPADRPALRRADQTCLTCHLTWDTRGVPGLIVMSVFSVPGETDKYSYASGAFSDHRSAFTERWGGWYVTGTLPQVRHLGNDTNLAVPNRQPSAARPLQSLNGLFDPRGFLSPHSDVAALMVLEHQATMTNLITRTGWEARVADHAAGMRAPLPAAPARAAAVDRVHDAVVELVDYMLFVDEAPFPGSIAGSSAFNQTFANQGPRDRQGRTLRELDLKRRLMRYPCSYLIYSEAFDSMPPSAKEAVYQRLWSVLSGEETAAPYARLSRADRTAIVEILLETRKGLPDVFRGPIAR